jgi:hypothetical protein
LKLGDFLVVVDSAFGLDRLPHAVVCAMVIGAILAETLSAAFLKTTSAN